MGLLARYHAFFLFVYLYMIWTLHEPSGEPVAISRYPSGQMVLHTSADAI